MTIEKRRRKVWHDKILHKKELQDRDFTLLFSSKKHKGDLKLAEDGPYEVHHINENGVVRLKTLD